MRASGNSSTWAADCADRAEHARVGTSGSLAPGSRHLRALLGKGNPDVTVVGDDVRDVAAILDGVRAGTDLSAPVCLIMGYLVHFFTPEAARDLVANYVAALAPGSYLVLSAVHEAVPPGVVDARQWRPGWEPVSLPPREGRVLAGVARL